MAIANPSFLYPPARLARDLASKKNAGDQPLQNAISVALNTAINGGLFSTTASVSAYSSANVQSNMRVLQDMGYTVSLSSTTLTISW